MPVLLRFARPVFAALGLAVCAATPLSMGCSQTVTAAPIDLKTMVERSSVVALVRLDTDGLQVERLRVPGTKDGRGVAKDYHVPVWRVRVEKIMAGQVGKPTALRLIGAHSKRRFDVFQRAEFAGERVPSTYESFEGVPLTEKRGFSRRLIVFLNPTGVKAPAQVNPLNPADIYAAWAADAYAFTVDGAAVGIDQYEEVEKLLQARGAS